MSTIVIRSNYGHSSAETIGTENDKEHSGIDDSMDSTTLRKHKQNENRYYPPRYQSVLPLLRDGQTWRRNETDWKRACYPPQGEGCPEWASVDQ